MASELVTKTVNVPVDFEERVNRYRQGRMDPKGKPLNFTAAFIALAEAGLNGGVTPEPVVVTVPTAEENAAALLALLPANTRTGAAVDLTPMLTKLDEIGQRTRATHRLLGLDMGAVFGVGASRAANTWAYGDSTMDLDALEILSTRNRGDRVEMATGTDSKVRGGWFGRKRRGVAR